MDFVDWIEMYHVKAWSFSLSRSGFNEFIYFCSIAFTLHKSESR